MTIFVSAVETGSFSAASRMLNMPLATVSRKVADLEAHLKSQLLVRSTRKLTLTDAGTAFLTAAKSILQQMNDAENVAAGEFNTPRGDLVVTAPIVFGRMHLLPIINEFLATFPEIAVRMVLSDRTLHMVDDRIDVACRVGHLPDSSMVAIKVGTVCRVVCGSPKYLAGHGKPKTPEDLAEHACVNFESLPSGPVWAFDPRGNKPKAAIPIHPRLSVNTAEAAIDAAIAGVGLTHVLSYQIAGAVEDGKLQLVLRDYEPEPIPVSLMYAGQGQMPLKTRSFLDFVSVRLKARLTGDKDRLRAGMAKAK